jgi:hypothetical protein
MHQCPFVEYSTCSSGSSVCLAMCDVEKREVKGGEAEAMETC